MSELFRCESMKYVQLILDEESAHDALRELGKFKMLHIEDHGTPENFLYKENKRRILECIVWQRKFESIRNIMKQNSIKPPGPEIEPADDWKIEGDFLVAIERYFGSIERDLITQLKFKEDESRQYNKAREQKYVVKSARNYTASITEESEQETRQGYDSMGTTERETQDTNILFSDDSFQSGSTTLYGTIPICEQMIFQRILFRVTKGPRNVISIFKPIDKEIRILHPVTGEYVAKSVFSITTIGNELPKRIRRICNLFSVNLYDVSMPLSKLVRECIDIETVLKNTKAQMQKILKQLIEDGQGRCPLVCWEKSLQEEQAICEALQKFYVVEEEGSLKQNTRRLIAAQCWIPEVEFPELQEVLRKFSKLGCSLNTNVKSENMPPTYFRTNKFTGIFQGIVDTYGIANYKEANPGLFTIITFPFLFGIMYGDIFHGSMITIFSLYLILNEKKFLRQKKLGQMGEIFRMAFGGRYLIIVMGFFAIYCGTIYNDCASIPLNLYGSHYIKPNVGSNSLDLIRQSDTPYPWGIDPEWYHKSNSLQFMNSMKMKMAVTIGVIQMTFGIILGLTNDIYFHDKLSIIFEFFPRICFMLSTFGYMIWMIIYKMCIDWNTLGRSPPNLIQTMIKMFLSPGSRPEPPLYDQTTQHYVQLALIIIAVISIPIMLFPKPLIKYYQWKRKYAQRREDDFSTYSLQISSNITEPGLVNDDTGYLDHGSVRKNFRLSDDFIYTGIHTIEFLLGCVSNTASYLRLWALSLAHAELSAVFWDKMIMQYGLNMFPLGFVGFAIWAAATVGVLLCMDVLECFLHALRLHWVEFQNKFYRGEGTKFKPFTFSDEN